MKHMTRTVTYQKVSAPGVEESAMPVELSDATMKERLNRTLEAMKQRGLDILVIYADREHGFNYSYLTGFEPRFEESLLILHRTGEAYLVLGNESLKMQAHSRLPAKAIALPYFSLPNQPMECQGGLADILKPAIPKQAEQIGIVGWKMFTSKDVDNDKLFDAPYFITEAVMQLAKDSSFVHNATDLFIHPEYGIRTRVNANEIAHYEFGATLASQGIKTILEALETGKTEMELINLASLYGQPTSVTTICATGERFTNAMVFPRSKSVSLGDRFSVTLGLRGGLTSRSGYVVSSEDQLPESERDYLEKVAKPYFGALSAWYEKIGIGITGKKIFEEIERVLPREEYHWFLNPGHFVADEEWLSSPISGDSKITFKSGMMLQMDIIPSVSGYGGASAEDGIVLADEHMQQSLASQYPAVYSRMKARQTYMRKELGICVKDEVLPLSSLTGCYSPFLLKKDYALTVKPEE